MKLLVIFLNLFLCFILYSRLHLNTFRYFRRKLNTKVPLETIKIYCLGFRRDFLLRIMFEEGLWIP